MSTVPAAILVAVMAADALIFAFVIAPLVTLTIPVFVMLMSPLGVTLVAMFEALPKKMFPLVKAFVKAGTQDKMPAPSVAITSFALPVVFGNVNV